MAANEKQQELADLPIGTVLAIAPAGCGKTEALAMRARAAIVRGDIAAPRKILAITYSNKAKSNLAARMRTRVGPNWRARITVANLHGLAARIVKAHGEQIGVSDDITLPERPWIYRKHRELGISWKDQAASDAFHAALREAKNGLFTNDDVWDHLAATGNQQAIDYEAALRDEGRLDFDDVIRHAARLLDLSTVAALYREHFALVLVDEVQDLSMLQLGMVEALGHGRVTYAGDPAQGIYTFAGAQPGKVFPAIEALSPATVELDVSYRSAPAVLRAVNALADAMGATQLRCADPDAWPDGGHVTGFFHDDLDDEAATLVEVISGLLENQQTTVGVVFRRATRVVALRKRLTEADIGFEDWTRATHLPGTVALLQRWWPQASKAAEDDPGRLDELVRLCREALEADDADSLDELATAVDQLEQALADDMTLSEALASCRASANPDAPVAAGLHLLTGHKGKGQEFDSVFIVGVEKGQIPDFRNEGPDDIDEELRVLHVMASRARHRLAFTFCATNYGRTQDRSPWLHLLEQAATGNS
ncbi:MAG: ATP-dependent helicase [Actinomycetota bacterium]